MERDQLKLIIAALSSNYKGFVVDTKEKFNFWEEALSDLEYSICQKAIMKIIMQEEYPPTIAKIRSEYLIIQGVKRLSNEEALILVNKAVGKGRYRSEEAMIWLKEKDECVWRVLKAIGFTNYCDSDPNFTRNTFIKMYSEAAESKENQLKLPEKFRKEIDTIYRHTLLLKND